MNHILSNQFNPPVDQVNFALRPQKLQEFIGQENLKEMLSVYLLSAKSRGQNLDHVLVYGPPGLGKTTLSQIIASEMNVNFKSTSGPILVKPADLAAILTNMKENEVLFIDEIHRLNIALEELLYSAMEDFNLDIIIGEGPSAKNIKIKLNKFTLVGATTRIGLISNPLRDRFGILLPLNFYLPHELQIVLQRGAELLKFNIRESGALEIANRARGTPRIALRLLRRVIDFAVVSKQNFIDGSFADLALSKIGVDKEGLNVNDYKYLKFISTSYGGGPVGLDTIAAGLGEEKDVIEETVEPYLIQIGFIQRTPRGRILNSKAINYFKSNLAI